MKRGMEMYKALIISSNRLVSALLWAFPCTLGKLSTGDERTSQHELPRYLGKNKPTPPSLLCCGLDG